MGWASSADYMQGTNMAFRSKEDAVAFVRVLPSHLISSSGICQPELMIRPRGRDGSTMFRPPTSPRFQPRTTVRGVILSDHI